jgi:transposase
MKRTAELPVIGMDIAKNVFQIHIMDFESGEMERAKLKRDRVVCNSSSIVSLRSSP